MGLMLIVLSMLRRRCCSSLGFYCCGGAGPFFIVCDAAGRRALWFGARQFLVFRVLYYDGPRQFCSWELWPVGLVLVLWWGQELVLCGFYF